MLTSASMDARLPAEQAVLLYGAAFARNRALYTADVAIQHAVRDRPEPEMAAAAAGKVLAFLPEVRSDRLLRSLHNVAGALQRHGRVPALHRQVLGHLRYEGFILAAAYASGTMVGFGYAFPCTPEYWYGDLLPAIPEHVRAGRLMGLCELAVSPAWQSQGIGSRLHVALLTAINPEWSSLLVRPDNQAGRRLYERMGYKYAGPYHNTPGGPEFDLLLLRVERLAA